MNHIVQRLSKPNSSASTRDTGSVREYRNGFRLASSTVYQSKLVYNRE
jgi:hypothetical protein